MGCCSSINQIQIQKSNYFLNKIKQKCKCIMDLKLSSYLKPQDLSSLISEDKFFQKIKKSQIYAQQAGGSGLISSERRTLWKICAFQTRMLIEINNQANLPPFLEHPKHYNQITQKSFHELSLDINRTYPNSVIDRQVLTTVLQNFILHFQGIGYVQGMNFYAGFLLLCGFSASESFYFMLSLCYNPGFLLIRNFTQKFQHTLFMTNFLDYKMQNSKSLNKSKIIINQYGITSQFYALSWFICYFLYDFSLQYNVLIWNYILTNCYKTSNNLKIIKEDEIIGTIGNIIQIGLSFIRHISSSIVKVQSQNQIFGLLKIKNLSEQLTFEQMQELIDSIGKVDPSLLVHRKELWQYIEKKDKNLLKILKSQQQYNTFMNQMRICKRNISVKKQ